MRQDVGRVFYEGSIAERVIAVSGSPNKFEMLGWQLILEETAISRFALAAFLREQQVELVRRDQLVRDALSICAITRPLMLPGMVNHLCANWIEFNVPLTSQKVAVVIDNTRSKTSFPQCSRSAIAPVDILNVTLS